MPLVKDVVVKPSPTRPPLRLDKKREFGKAGVYSPQQVVYSEVRRDAAVKRVRQRQPA